MTQDRTSNTTVAEMLHDPLTHETYDSTFGVGALFTWLLASTFAVILMIDGFIGWGLIVSAVAMLCGWYGIYERHLMKQVEQFMQTFHQQLLQEIGAKYTAKTILLSELRQPHHYAAIRQENMEYEECEIRLHSGEIHTYAIILNDDQEIALLPRSTNAPSPITFERSQQKVKA